MRAINFSSGWTKKYVVAGSQQQYWAVPSSGRRRLPPQASQYYLNNPAMNDYLKVKFQPIVKLEPKKASVQPSQPLEIKLILDASNGWQPVATKL
jgi:hypothetical protein